MKRTFPLKPVATGSGSGSGGGGGEEQEEQLFSSGAFAEERIVEGPASPVAQQPRVVDASKILGRVEQFLLPQMDFYSRWSVKKQQHRDTFGSGTGHEFEVTGLCPVARLDDILYQVALADHIRTMQTMYRDMHDEHRLVGDLRAGHPNTTLPTKQLMVKITEGRVRCQALCRLCFGDESVEMLRATVDLASAYALQGLWAQVTEHMAVSSQKLVEVTAPHHREQQVLQAIAAREAAAKVEATYRVLREHAMRNSGHITRHVLRELVAELTQVTKSCSDAHTDTGSGKKTEAISHPTQLAALLHGFFIKFAAAAGRPLQPGGGGEQHLNQQQQQLPLPPREIPSWGDVVDYLRNECVLMRLWVQEMEMGILPQNRAVLQLPFRQADKQKRGVAHPQQVAHYLARVPSAVRVLAGSTLVKRLQQLKVEVPLIINAFTGDIIFQGVGGPTQTQTQTQTQKVLYELPVCIEEVLALHVAELEADPVDLLRAQVLTLLGVCNIFSNKLGLAEENMREALKQIEMMGLETEVTACELYNSVAQMMITRYRNWQAQKKLRAKQAATDYIFKDPKGQEELSSAVTLLKQQIKARNAVVPTADIVSKAKSTLIAQHSKTILANEDDPTKKAIEAAFRYLVKSYEILVVAHGQIHPSVGTACLAVASVQSIVGNYQVAREWLVRGLRSLERLDPMPVRAVAFVQTQLSQVLSKQGHNDEALRVLDKAARFHLAHAKEKLANSQVYSGGFVTTPPVLKGTSLYDEATLAIELTSRLVVLSRRVRNLWAAAEQAEVAAELAEATFGWDSALVCDKRKEASLAVSPYPSNSPLSLSNSPFSFPHLLASFSGWRLLRGDRGVG